MRNRASRKAHVAAWTGIAALALSILTAPSARAVDGVIEINQARAAAGSITPADGGGFPVTIGASGSFRLTSDLTVPAGADGIFVTSNNVTIDLNGFTIFGGGGSIADGISLPSVQNIEIRNGTVRGFSRNGIFSNTLTEQIRVIGVRAIGNTGYGIDVKDASTIDECQALNNGTNGIRVGIGSLIINSVSRGHQFNGLILGAGSGYRSNVVTGNNGSDAVAQVSGGLQLGTNVCGSDTVCP